MLKDNEKWVLKYVLIWVILSKWVTEFNPYVEKGKKEEEIPLRND